MGVESVSCVYANAGGCEGAAMDLRELRAKTRKRSVENTVETLLSCPQTFRLLQRGGEEDKQQARQTLHSP